MMNIIKKSKANTDSGNSQNKWLKLNKDNNGAAMVMVLVIIMFISILAAVLMFISYLGYQMRLMDKRGKDTFYSAETVLDEINAGLQEEASAAMAEAYNDVMQNFAVYDNAITRSSRFNQIYIDTFRKSLEGTTGNGHYDIEKFQKWLSKGSVGDYIGKVDADSEAEDKENPNRAKREYFRNYGAIVESNITPGSYVGVLETKEGESIVIKDLKVTYVDTAGYVSIISTDIRLTIPVVSFSQASELPRLEKFSLIADETLAMGNTASGVGVTINGNAYAGRMSVGGTDEHSFINGSSASFKSVLTGKDNMSLVISRENVEVSKGSILTTDNVEFWGENVLLTGSGASFDGVTNLKDDLILEGKGSELRLSGEYNGFSMIEGTSGASAGSGDSEDDSVDPALSSAIVVNGQESSLDLSKLTSMTIAGHSYVQTKSAEDSTDVNKNKNNVMMAESVAVKSNQLIYLAPAEAIGCVIESDGTIGDTAYGANPLSLEQYQEIMNPDNQGKYCLLDGDRPLTALGYKPLNNYISREKVKIGDGYESLYWPEVIFKQAANGKTLVYCYLKFTSEEKANQYFKDYYDLNSSQIDRYTRLYAKEIKMPDTDDILYLNLAGSMLAYNGDATSVITAPDNGNSSYSIKQKQARTIYTTKTSAFKALSAKLVSDITAVTVAEQSKTAFDNIINTEKLDDMFAALGSKIEIKTGSGINAKTAIFAKNDYVIDASTHDNSLIICKGDVRVTKSFKGLIIADGDIVVESTGAGIELTPFDLADYALLLEASEEFSGTTYYVIDAFRDGVNYKTDASSQTGANSETVTLKNLIIYEKWNKR